MSGKDQDSQGGFASNEKSTSAERGGAGGNLEDVAGLGAGRIEALESAGIDTVGAFLGVGASEASDAIGVSESTETFAKIWASARDVNPTSQASSEEPTKVLFIAASWTKAEKHMEGTEDVIAGSNKYDDIGDLIGESLHRSEVSTVEWVGVETAYGENLGRKVTDWKHDLPRQKREAFSLKSFEPNWDVADRDDIQSEMGPLSQDDVDKEYYKRVFAERDIRMFEWCTDVVVLTADALVGYTLGRAEQLRDPPRIHVNHIISGAGFREQRGFEESESTVDGDDATANSKPGFDVTHEAGQGYDIETSRPTGSHPSQEDPFVDGDGEPSSGKKEFTSGQ